GRARIGAEPELVGRARHRRLGSALRARPDANEPLLDRCRHRGRLAFGWNALGTNHVFVPGVEPAHDLDVRVGLAVGPRTGVLKTLTEGLVVGARAELRQAARLPVDLKGALALILERG